MKIITFSILSLIALCAKAQSTDTLTVVGNIIDLHPTNTTGIDKLELDVNGDTIDFIYYYEELYESSDDRNRKVKITYTVNKMLKEVDMYANGSTVYTERKKAVDTTKALKVKGLLDIYDLGCSMPGKYFIQTKDSSTIAISHYVSWKYQKPHEFKEVTVYYRTYINYIIQEISFIDSSSSTLLDEIPEAFFKQTGISKESIATNKADFISGYVRGKNDKNIFLKSVKANKKNSYQTICLTFGGKRVYTKEYRLNEMNGTLEIKSKKLK